MLARRLLSSVSSLCASAGTSRRRCELAIDYTFGFVSHQVRGAYIILITFSSLAPRCRIERLLDPTTSYSFLSNKPKQPCPPRPSKPCLAMLLLLAPQPLLSMHARMLSLVTSCYSLDWAITLLYCCGWYDYYNVDYIRRRME